MGQIPIPLILLFVTLVLILWRMYEGAHRGLLAEFFSFVSVILAFACILLGMAILRRLFSILPWDFPILSTLVGAQKAELPQNAEELLDYVPTIAGFIQSLPGLILRFVLLTIACKIIGLVGKGMTVVKEIPVIGGINRFLGAIFGAAEGILIMALGLYILGIPLEGIADVLIWLAGQITGNG